MQMDNLVEQPAKSAGLIVVEAAESRGYKDVPTMRYRLARPERPNVTATLELSTGFDLSGAAYESGIASFLRDLASRLRNPRPEQAVTVAGMPLGFTDFAWPFHTSTSGADTYVVHGLVKLEDGKGGPLHAKLGAAMTLTFAEIVPAPEQPFAESFVYNAARKMLDQGQLELLKSGNRQPVPVTTRYYSRWSKKFTFTDTNAETRQQFLLKKLYWLSTVNGGNAPVWMADPMDAQYLNATPEELVQAGIALEQQGLARGWDNGMWSATAKTAEHADEFEATLSEALLSIKPTFNEEMRAGHTNM